MGPSPTQQPYSSNSTKNGFFFKPKLLCLRFLIRSIILESKLNPPDLYRRHSFSKSSKPPLKPEPSIKVLAFTEFKANEAAILELVKKNFSDHLILGEEGGIIGDSSSDYLWCIDPLDGTTNFAHGYPSFVVSVGVLYHGKPAAASVVEFVGGHKLQRQLSL